MRSRPSLTVFLSPGAPRPGDVLDVEARFESKSETPLEKVVFELVGTEKVTFRRGRNTVTWRHPHTHLRAEHPGRTLTPGTHTYRARFQLPLDLPPQYWGRYCWVDYVLEVRAAIPWWPDRVGKYSVPLAQLPLNALPKQGVFVTDYGGPKSGELYAELSLASTVAEPGGELQGTVAFTNAGRERGVRVALVAFERLFPDAGFFQGGSLRETVDVRRWTHTLSNGPPEEGRGLPFRFAIAPDTVASFTGKMSALEWAIEVVAERTFTSRTVLRAPVLIVPRTSAARLTVPAAIPAVGLERRAQSFQAVGARAGLAYDPDHDELRGAAGSVTVRVGVERRPDGTLTTVAQLAWRPLGMGLRLGPRSWVDWLEGSAVQTGVAEFDKRFHAQSRIPAQARALLDERLAGILSGFEDARADDDGATFAVPVALVDEAPLEALVKRAMLAAAAFDEAFERVPPPPPLEPHAGAWRDFAARLGGVFQPSRGAILDATFGLERVEIVTTWADEGERPTTLVSMPLGVRVDPTTISPAARALAGAFDDAAGTRVVFSEDAVALSLPQLVPDPASLEPVLESLTRLAHAVRGRGAAGPFRS